MKSSSTTSRSYTSRSTFTSKHGLWVQKSSRSYKGMLAALFAFTFTSIVQEGFRKLEGTS